MSSSETLDTSYGSDTNEVSCESDNLILPTPDFLSLLKTSEHDQDVEMTNEEDLDGSRDSSDQSKSLNSPPTQKLPIPLDSLQDTPINDFNLPSYDVLNQSNSSPFLFLSYVTNPFPGFGEFFADYSYPDPLSFERLTPLTSLPSTPSTSTSSEWEDTLIIFDWDDTLLPSTWLAPGKLTAEGIYSFDPEEEASLSAISEAVRHTLYLASQCGHVIIVTNAESGWIELSCDRFFPNLSSYLKEFTTISARSTYTGQPVFNPSLWKQQAFYNIINHFCNRNNERKNSKKNIISIGDSMHERSALIYSQRNLNELLILPKSIKFIERPNIYELTKEHEIIHNWFNELILHQGLLDLVVLCHKNDLTIDANGNASFIPSFNILNNPIDCPSSTSTSVNNNSDLLISVENYS